MEIGAALSASVTLPLTLLGKAALDTFTNLEYFFCYGGKCIRNGSLAKESGRNGSEYPL